MLLPLRYRRAWLALFWFGAAAIATGSLLPLEVAAPEFPGADKFRHLLAYLGLTALGVGLVARRAVGWIALGVFAFGALLELAQALLTATRQADGLDLLANGTGIAVAAGLGWLGLAGWIARLEARLGWSPQR